VTTQAVYKPTSHFIQVLRPTTARRQRGGAGGLLLCAALSYLQR